MPWLNERIAPTVLVGKSYVAFAVNPEKARAALASEGRPGGWKPEGELARSFAGLPGALTSLSVGDPGHCPLPDLLSSLPAYVQVYSNLMFFSAGEGATPATMFHSALGIPAPGGFRLRIAPEKIPTAEQVRARLFPSVLATVVNDRGFRWIGREAFPFAGVPGTDSMKMSQNWNLSKPADSKLKLNLDLLHLLGIEPSGFGGAGFRSRPTRRVFGRASIFAILFCFCGKKQDDEEAAVLIPGIPFPAIRQSQELRPLLTPPPPEKIRETG